MDIGFTTHILNFWLEYEIKGVTTMMDGEVCEHENFDPELMKYCPDCGEAVSVCPNCEGNVEADWKYCPFCDKKLKD
jgi:hypothetical protein